MKKTTVLCAILSSVVCLSASAEPIVVLTGNNTNNRLLTFDSATPGTITRNVTVTGLQGGEVLRAIDFRPFDGALYALGSSDRIYRVDPFTGAATAVGGAFMPASTGTRFGFDFNPTVDRIRLTSNEDQNLRLNPISGAVANTDTNLAYAMGDANEGLNPNVVGSAYTNNFAGAQATTLYDIDSNRDVLAIQNPPNSGTLNTVGMLGVDTSHNVGFDISTTTGMAYASLFVGGSNGLYTINLATGAATLVGAIADAATLGGDAIFGLAVPTFTRLLNLSTRGRVGADENVLIAGLISRGVANSRFVLRGRGPSIGGGVGTLLADPVLTLFDSNGAQVAMNNDWKSSQQTAIEATGLAPTNDMEAAILADLPPGSYTAHVTGNGGTQGVAIVEIFQVP